MQGIAKGVLTTILVSACILLFTNLVFFFPWYMTMVVETFSLSQIAASDNYIKETYYEDTLERITERPIYNEDPDSVKISITNENGDAVGDDDETKYESLNDWEKPYMQRGEPISVTVSARYPLQISLWGKVYKKYIPVSFSLKPIGLKHYKDLPLDF